jgi:tRNA dimethylallyltransferase
MRLAERRRALIISADSRQIYRGFDVGTAKPTPAERARVEHRGVDVADPIERYSAAAWAAAASGWIDEAHRERREVVIVGGTGFYLRALFAPLFNEPDLDQARRGSLQRELASLSLGELRRWCAALDPARSHLGRTQLLRAIEIALLTGERLSAMHAREARPARWRPRYLVVDPGPILGERIVSRVDAMFRDGWIEEVKRLSAEVPPDAPAWNAAGYEAVREVVSGASSVAAARERVVIETRQYAKRQRTWLRHQLEGGEGAVLRINPDAHDAFDHAEQWWSGGSA